MAEKVSLKVKLNLDHELGHDHFQTWLSQLEIAFQLHGVTENKLKYLAAAANLGESAAHYLWQRYPTIPSGSTPYESLKTLFEEYFGSTKSVAARLAALFTITQQDGESVQAFRHRIRKEMRTCDLTTTASVGDVVETVGVHLFARGLKSSSARQRVLEQGDKTLADAAEHAQAVVLSEEQAHESVDMSRLEVSYATTQQRASHASSSSCAYCGRVHPPGRSNCPAADQTCGKCGKKGHFRAVCRGRATGGNASRSAYNQSSGGTRRSDDVTRGPNLPMSSPSAHPGSASSGSSVHYASKPANPCSGSQDEPWVDAFTVCGAAGKTGFSLPLREIWLDNQVVIPMRVDSGSCVTILPQSKVPSAYTLKSAPFKLRPLGANTVEPIGVFEATLRYLSRTTVETVFVVPDCDGRMPSLLGEGVSIRLGLLPGPDVSVSAVDPEVVPEAEHTEDLPPMKGAVRITLNPEVPPVQQSARRVAPALLPSLRKQLDTWIQQGVVEMVEEVGPDDFVSPLVAVPKPDKSRRWCVDLRCVNTAVRRPGIQLPTADELLTQLGDAQVFSKIDLKTGYSQLEITPDCRQAFVVASPLGYFRFCRLPFGVSSGPELFQRKIEQILAGCEGVLVYLDDILVFGTTAEEHDRRLEAVRAALAEYNVTIHPGKSEFSKTELPFLGHQLSSGALSPTPEKLQALEKLHDPVDLKSLRAFLGFVTYLGKFMPNMAEVAQPLTNLLKSPWNWTSECQSATQRIRQQLMSSPILALFDPQLPTRVEVDASGCGLGAVLLQQHASSTTASPEWKPVYYASRKLSPAEVRYAAIEMEALAVVWGVNRLRSFLTGTSFQVLTDHKPLLQVFSPTYCLANASIRVQRLVLKVQDMDFQVAYRPGRQNYLADALSRLPVDDADPDYHIINHVTLDDGLTSAERRRIASLTAQDATLQAVRKALQTSKWPKSDRVSPYEALQRELSVWEFPNSPDFVIQRGDRLVIPEAAVDRVIRLAHSGHPGIAKTKQRLSETVWWPGWSKAVKLALQACEPCVQEARVPLVPLKMRDLPPHPWHTVAVDIFYFQQMPFFSLMDVYSRYPTVVKLQSETSSSIIAACMQIFSLFGLPRHLISDNGRQFSSAEFEARLKEWSISHELIVPYTPRQNPVERMHQTLKKLMRQADCSRVADSLRVALTTIRSTVCTSTGKTPGDCLLRGAYQTPLRQLQHPLPSETDEELDDDVREHEAKAKATAKANFERRHVMGERTLQAEQSVLVRQPDGSCQKATVITANAHEATVTTAHGVTQRRHIDRIQIAPSATASAAEGIPNAPATATEDVVATGSGESSVRRSARPSHPPVRFGDEYS